MEPLAIPSSGGARPESGKGARRRKPVRLPAAGASEMLLIRIAPRDTGLFRYLLEGGGGHLAMLTVLDPRAALFKLLFSPHQREELEALLESMRKTVPFEVRRWPVKTPAAPDHQNLAEYGAASACRDSSGNENSPARAASPDGTTLSPESESSEPDAFSAKPSSVG